MRKIDSHSAGGAPQTPSDEFEIRLETVQPGPFIVPSDKNQTPTKLSCLHGIDNLTIGEWKSSCQNRDESRKRNFVSILIRQPIIRSHVVTVNANEPREVLIKSLHSGYPNPSVYQTRPLVHLCPGIRCGRSCGPPRLTILGGPRLSPGMKAI